MLYIIAVSVIVYLVLSLPHLAVCYFISNTIKDTLSKRRTKKDSDLKYIATIVVTLSSLLLFIYVMISNISSEEEVRLYALVFGICMITAITKGFIKGAVVNDRILQNILSVQIFLLPIAYFIIAFKSPWNFNF